MAENNATPVNKNSVEDLKKQLWDNLMDRIIDAMLHGNATLKDGKESAQFMLDRLDPVKSKEELLQFLFDIQTKWSLYNPIYVKIKYSFEGEKDTKKIEDLKSKLYTFIQPK